MRFRLAPGLMTLDDLQLLYNVTRLL